MTLYEILEVKETASDWQIKRSYRRLVKIYHPDKPTGDAEKFRQIQSAYDNLINSSARATYDRKIKRPTSLSFNIKYFPPSPMTGYEGYFRKRDVVKCLRDAADFYGEDLKVSSVLSEVASAMEQMG